MLMQFGLPGGRGDLDGTAGTSAVELARISESLGYDSLWFTDGHLDSVGSRRVSARPAPIPLATAVAAVTRSISLGFTALHLPLHDPIRLAADLATLDRLSGGRVILGVGWPLATYAQAYRGDGDATPDAPDADDLPEALDTIVGYWRGRTRTVGGAHYRVGPTPAQHPHPPIEVAARTDESVVWAASRGYALLLSAVATTASVAASVRLYTSHGGQAADVRVERFCLVAESDGAAAERATPIVVRLTRRLAALGGDEHGHQTVGTSDLDPGRFQNDTAIIGGPATVARQVALLRDELGIRRVNLRPSFSGTASLALQQSTVRMFAGKVRPLLAVPTIHRVSR
ncbi:LLM class flavin-dependent oxidoreductase [Frankia sp. AgB32]|uniref:LLM class flavin-dependent oxidoreductase n=1 Tax=Frankia sp. AgB32 TaxID=631119 RepID=UPI00200CE682|nr:LLM class flavin-dependent oxidoreductase [Frankia sp. AgB32]MCK9893687.1 LLM class flavin-dependent oxidoreductase [Frankia sp. AgB32]